MTPVRIINSSAPTRICDIGGWTDTWFAKRGRVFNIAIDPRVEVEVCVGRRTSDQPWIAVHAEDLDLDFTFDTFEGGYQHNPLVEAALDYMQPPEDMALEVTVYSRMPEGAGVGASSAIAVALIAALDRLTPGRLTAHEMAYAAQHVESELLGEQAGIQDQLAAAYGGLQYIEVTRFPDARASQVAVPPAVWWELERRLALVYVGGPHHTTRMHEAVIRGLPADAEAFPPFERLRALALQARDAVATGDLDAFGEILTQANDAQAELHEGVVTDRHRHVIDLARRRGAIGGKVNGAGGEGGSVSLFMGAGRAHGKRRMLDALREDSPDLQIVPLRLCPQGVRVWEPPVAERE